MVVTTYVGLNRTSVGLKLAKDTRPPLKVAGLNRTSVGLKLCNGKGHTSPGHASIEPAWD